MGMFDNFVPSEKIVCPVCKKEIEEGSVDLPYKCVLQSKALDCFLNIYKQGEPVEMKNREKDFYIRDGWIEAHTVCDKCDAFVKFKLIIENGVWTRIEKWGKQQGRA